MLTPFEYITRSSQVSLDEIKLIAIVNCLFHESNFLRLFVFQVWFHFFKVLCD